MMTRTTRPHDRAHRIARAAGGSLVIASLAFAGVTGGTATAFADQEVSQQDVPAPEQSDPDPAAEQAAAQAAAEKAEAERAAAQSAAAQQSAPQARVAPAPAEPTGQPTPPPELASPSVTALVTSNISGDGHHYTDETITISGAITPGSGTLQSATLKLNVGGTPLINLTPAPDGTYSTTLTEDLARFGQRDYLVTVTATNTEGKTTTHVVNFRIEAITASTITLNTPDEINDDQDAVLTGTWTKGSFGAPVQITLTKNGTTLTTTATTTRDTWTTTIPAADIGPGTWTVTATVTNPRTGTATTHDTLLVNAIADPTIDIDEVGVRYDDKALTFTGTVTQGTHPLGSVEVKIDAGEWEPAAFENGLWDFATGGALRAGDHRIMVRVVDSKGTAGTASADFTVGELVAPPVESPAQGTGATQPIAHLTPGVSDVLGAPAPALRTDAPAGVLTAGAASGSKAGLTAATGGTLAQTGTDTGALVLAGALVAGGLAALGVRRCAEGRKH